MPATILVVEDDASIAGTIREVLLGAGYVVPDAASTGQRALEAAARSRPALVLMDVELDGEIDGIETARQLRERTGARVIYLTGFSDDETLRRAKQTSPLGYLKKPFNARELRISVEIALHQIAVESALAAREQWFATTLQSIGEAVVTTDGVDRVTFLNRAAEAILGVSTLDAMGKSVDEVVRLVDRRGAPTSGVPRRSGAQGAAVALPRDARLLTFGGARPAIEIDGSVAPIVLDGANVFGSVMVFSDVTARRHLERRLAMANRLAALGSMAAGMQHEINNPLASVVANVQFTLDALRASPSGIDSAAIPELVTALREATEGAERVRRTIEDLRHFSRSAEGVDAPIDVTTALDEAVRMTAHTVRHHAAVHREYAPTPPVRAEEGQLARVFVNLLLHAAQATGDGGAEQHTIVLRTRTDAHGRAVVEVADDGPGIASEALHRVFDPFFKTQEADPAIGLGLAICHSIVSSLGGEIEVESEVGAGTTFRVSLPAAEPDLASAPRSAPTPPAPAPAPAPTSPTATRRARVLIIDDEAAIGRALRRLLVSEHDVTVESDARAALTRLASEAFDVVFCDLMMPHMSGMDFYAALSSTAPEQAARIVFLTGGAFSPRSVEFLRDNENVCLSKPFSRDSVTSAIRALMTDRA